MPSAFTHALVGAALAGAAPAGMRSGALVAGLAAASVLPDLDWVGFAAGVPYEHPLGHRGLTHSLPFALALGAGVWAALRARAADTAGRRRAAVAGALAAAACASHGLLDAATDAGLGIGFWIPFSDARHFWSWRPLATAPLEPGAFFSERGARVLASEIRVVWLPLLAVAAGVALARRRWTGPRAEIGSG